MHLWHPPHPSRKLSRGKFSTEDPRSKRRKFRNKDSSDRNGTEPERNYGIPFRNSGIFSFRFHSGAPTGTERNGPERNGTERNGIAKFRALYRSSWMEFIFFCGSRCLCVKTAHPIPFFEGNVVKILNVATFKVRGWYLSIRESRPKTFNIYYANVHARSSIG